MLSIKIFSNIVTERLNRWAHDLNIIDEVQSGFRSGFSVIDNMFTLQCMVQTYISRTHGRLYVLYVDFQKAFGCLVHYKLVSNMLSKGANGNIIRLLMSMYEKLETYVKITYSPLRQNRRENSMSLDKIAGPFRCNIGTRQGD